MRSPRIAVITVPIVAVACSTVSSPIRFTTRSVPSDTQDPIAVPSPPRPAPKEPEQTKLTVPAPTNQSIPPLKIEHYLPFRIHAGAATVRPVGYEQVDPQDPSAGYNMRVRDGSAFYLEMDYIARKAYHPEDTAWQRTDASFLTRLDFDVRMGFLDDRKPIGDQGQAASGNWFGSMAVALPISIQSFAGKADGYVAASTGNVEIGTLLDTDKASAASNLTEYFGYSYTASLIWGESGTSPAELATINAGIFYAYSNAFPSVPVDAFSPTRAYDYKSAVMLRFEMSCPVTRGIDLVVLASHMTVIDQSINPDIWSVFVGLTVPIGQIFRAATGALSGST